jgi:hypothetical protein
VTPDDVSACFEVTFLKDICTNCAVPLLFFTRIATISAFTRVQEQSSRPAGRGRRLPLLQGEG